MQYQRDTLLSDLRNSIIEVTFTKVNGERRAMRCTLMPHYLPESFKANAAEQEQEQEQEQRLEVEWNRLQLEQGQWSIHARVEQIATQQLRMRAPSAARTQLVAAPATPRSSASATSNPGAQNPVPQQ